MERLICTKRGPWRYQDGTPFDMPAPSYGEELTPDDSYVDGNGVLCYHFPEYDWYFSARWFVPVDPMEAEIASLLELQLETA